MRAERLYCADFRNLKELVIEPEAGMNVICGENAQGKTNIIEAIWLFTGAKSFRGTKEKDFINFEKTAAFCELDFMSQGTANTAKIEFCEKKTAFLNEKKLAAPSLLAGNFNAVVFSPSDISLVRDGPDKRRRFLDTAIGQLYPNYIEILRGYIRAVMQRNRIIKDFRYDSTLSVMLDVFEAEIAQSGEKIMSYRKKYLNKLEMFLPEIYGGLSGGREKILSVYVANVNDINLSEALLKSRRDDCLTGVTSVGPHRDDVEFMINGISARGYGSQGQIRSTALALKLAQAEVIKEISGEYPVCLLDDVMSELDPARQNYVLNHISGIQSFITCCDPGNTERLRQGKIIEIKNGRSV